MKFKKLITILTVSAMVLGNSVWSYAYEIPKDSKVQQEYSDMEARMEQERMRIEQEILERIENSPVTLSEGEVNPMGLPDIDPVTNPASDNWLTREVASQVGKDNISQLTQEDFNKIIRIFLESNGISEIPPEISNLFNLQYLDLPDNQLTEIPKEISNLSNLYALVVDFNQLIEIPAEISDLSNLQHLYLQDNQITEIPVVIFSLSNLQSLYLDNNQIAKLPNEISNLTNLQSSYLYNQNIKLSPKYIAPIQRIHHPKPYKCSWQFY